MNRAVLCNSVGLTLFAPTLYMQFGHQLLPLLYYRFRRLCLGIIQYCEEPALEYEVFMTANVY